MNAPEKIHKLVETAELFEKKEILVTINAKEQDELLSWIENTGSSDIEYNLTPGAYFPNLRTIEYLGVTIHFHVL